MEIEKKLYSEIKEYCKVNGLKIGDFINDLLKKAFTVEKFGETPPFFVAPTITVEEFFGDDVKSKHWIDTEVKESEQFCEYIKNRLENNIVDNKCFVQTSEIMKNNGVPKEYVDNNSQNPKVFDKPAEITQNAVWDDSEKFEKKTVKRKLK